MIITKAVNGTVELKYYGNIDILCLYISLYIFTDINIFGYLEHAVARGIMKFQCKPWEFSATSCSRHPDLFIPPLYCIDN